MAEEERKKTVNGDDQQPKTSSEEEFKLCPSCGERNQLGTNFCGSCGIPFKETLHCPNCGKQIPVYFTFCSFCGKPVSSALHRWRQQQQRQTNTSSSSFMQPQTQAPPPSAQLAFPSHQIVISREEMLRQQHMAQIDSRRTTAKIIGILALVFAGLHLFFIGFSLFLIITDSYYQQLISDLEITLGGLIASILTLTLPITAALGVMGFSLIKPKNPSRPWKSLYHNFRYFFLSISLLIAGLIIIATFCWYFYFPKTVYPGPEIFWFFGIFIIPLNNKISSLYLLVLSFFFISIVLLILPTVTTAIKKSAKKRRTINTTFSEEKETKDEKEPSGETLREPTQKTDAFLQPQQEQHHPQYRQMTLTYRTRRERLRAARERKGPMPIIFERIKNTPLIRSIELLGLMTVLSIILVYLLAGSSGGNGSPLPEDPFEVTFEVGWAGIFEELSFRLLLIGVPMVFVVLGRFFLQKHFHDRKKTPTMRKELPKEEDSFEEKILKQPRLTLKDLLLSFRGKYKIVGIPEWILIACSSLIFGFAHWEGWTGSWPAWKIVQASVSGFFLSYAFVKFGLEASIFMHISNNLISSLTYYAYSGGANWIGIFANVCLVLLLFGGVMKAISFVINQIYVHHIVNQPSSYWQ